ncbi:glycosyltransferase family 2 protein [Aquimarina agarilytica]|uniref:glycosyltransferase family 2 protein n=1 Tax=Aquimarina agarilytica TaxID=1087449 RepID=UPI000288E39C|nr:glycosyltransferase family 2 protein [Aquimarina agarilytica]
MRLKLTIITATYNSSRFIEDCMNSVLSQDYENIEYLIIDGASTDDTLSKVKLAAAFNPKIKIISEKDNGIYDALNKGVRHATGDIVGFVHSDDFLASKNIFSNIIDVFEKKDVDGVYGDLDYVDKDNVDSVVRVWKSCDFYPSLLKKGWMPAHPTLFLKKQVYRKHGSFNLKYKIAADYDFMVRIFKDETLKFKYVNKVFTKMRIGGASNRSIKNIIHKTKEDYSVIKSNKAGGLDGILNKNVSKIKQFFIR